MKTVKTTTQLEMDKLVQAGMIYTQEPIDQGYDPAGVWYVTFEVEDDVYYRYCSLDELLTLRQSFSSIDEYRAIDAEISRRYERFNANVNVV